MRLENPRYRWVVLISNCLLFALLAVSLTSWDVAVGALSETFGLEGYQIMYGASIFVLGYGVSNGIYGKLVGKIGYRTTGCLALTLAIIAQIAIPLCQNWNLILLLRFFMGFGLMATPLYYINGLWFPEEELGLAHGILCGSLTGGFALGGLLMGILEPVLGWKRTYSLLSILTLVAGIQWLIFARKPKVESVQTVKEIKKVKTTPVAAVNLHGKSIWSHSMMWIMGLIMFSEFFVVYALQGMASVYFGTLGYDITRVGVLVFIIGIIGIASGPLGGILSDVAVKKNLGRKGPHACRATVMFVGGFLVTAIGCFLTPIIGFHGFAAAVVCMLIAGWGMPWMDGTAVATSIDVFGPELGDQAIGNMTFLGSIGGVISPVLTTWVGEHISWTLSWIVLATISMTGLIACVYTARLKTDSEKEKYI